jgi:hypothetical protein
MQSTATAAILGLVLTAALSEPRITGIAPKDPVMGPKPQQITITGQDFRPGLTVTATTPGGQVRTLSGADIMGLKATTFNLSFTFDAMGAYEFVVLNTDGGKSPPFRVETRKASKTPWVDRVEPAELSRSPEPQLVTILGGNFEPGSRVSVTDPTGTVTVRDMIDRLEANRVVLRIPFELSGTYSLMVTHPSGPSSNTVTMTIR